jgi:hypothetical protein
MTVDQTTTKQQTTGYPQPQRDAGWVLKATTQQIQAALKAGELDELRGQHFQ